MTIRRTLLVATATVGVVGALIAGANADDTNDRSTSDRSSSTACRGSSGGSYADGQLHQDYTMTQYMGSPNASGNMFSGQTTDPQLEHSEDPCFVGQLETHQSDMDRMLGKGQP